MCSIYDNKISLKVGGKLIAEGDLVIINDRFGVKINNITESSSESESVESYNYESQEEKEEEDFDYSDFEVEDGE